MTFADTRARSGDLQITKECSAYFGLPGQFCTITSSNVKAIKVGSRVIYTDGAGAAGVDTDIVLYVGPGNRAFGHVQLSFATMSGTVTFDGGTGEFRHFRATAAVSFLADSGEWAWDGDYTFCPTKDGKKGDKCEKGDH